MRSPARSSAFVARMSPSRACATASSNVSVPAAAAMARLCPERRSIGSFVDGGFAPRLLVPVRNLHRIPVWLDARGAR